MFAAEFGDLTVGSALRFLASHAPLLLGGSTALLAGGWVAMRLQRSPAQRQRLGELAIATTLVWAVLACIPLHRPLQEFFGRLRGAQADARAPAGVASPAAPSFDFDLRAYGNPSPRGHARSSLRWSALSPSNDPAETQAAGGAVVLRADQFEHQELIRLQNALDTLEERVATPADGAAAPAPPPVRGRDDAAVNFDGHGGSVGAEIDPGRVVGAIYLVGATACGAWLALGHLLLQRLLRAARGPGRWLSSQFESLRQELAPGRPGATLRVSDRCGRPMSCGVFRQVVLLPAGLAARAERDPDARALVRHVLRHELAHVRRRDALGHLLLNLALPLLYCHPFYWLIRRDVCLARELIADDFAASAATGGRAEYARRLVAYARDTLKLKESRPSLAARAAVGLIGAVQTRSTFYRRMAMLLQRPARTSLATRCTPRWGVAAGTTAATVLAAAVFAGGAAPAPRTPASTNEPSTTAAPSADTDVTVKAEVRIPVLSEIPIIGRLFTSEGVAPAADSDAAEPATAATPAASADSVEPATTPAPADGAAASEPATAPVPVPAPSADQPAVVPVPVPAGGDVAPADVQRSIVAGPSVTPLDVTEHHAHADVHTETAIEFTDDGEHDAEIQFYADDVDATDPKLAAERKRAVDALAVQKQALPARKQMDAALAKEREALLAHRNQLQSQIKAATKRLAQAHARSDASARDSAREAERLTAMSKALTAAEIELLEARSTIEAGNAGFDSPENIAKLKSTETRVRALQKAVEEQEARLGEREAKLEAEAQHGEGLVADLEQQLEKINAQLEAVGERAEALAEEIARNIEAQVQKSIEGKVRFDKGRGDDVHEKKFKPTEKQATSLSKPAWPKDGAKMEAPPATSFGAGNGAVGIGVSPQLDLVTLATSYADAVGAIQVAEARLAQARQAGSAVEQQVEEAQLKTAHRKAELLRRIAETSLHSSRAKLERTATLYKNGIISAEEMEESEAKVKILQLILGDDGSGGRDPEDKPRSR